MVYDSKRGALLTETAEYHGNGTIPMGNSESDELWEWDGEVWTLVEVQGSQAHSAHGHVMTYDSLRGVSVLIGGGSTTEGTWFEGLNQPWEFNGSEGVKESPLGSNLQWKEAGRRWPMIVPVESPYSLEVPDLWQRISL